MFSSSSKSKDEAARLQAEVDALKVQLNSLKVTVEKLVKKEDTKSTHQGTISAAVLTDVLAKVGPGLEIAVQTAEEASTKVDRTAVKIDDMTQAMLMTTEATAARLSALEENEEASQEFASKLAAKLDTMSADFNQSLKTMFAQISNLKGGIPSDEEATPIRKGRPPMAPSSMAERPKSAMKAPAPQVPPPGLPPTTRMSTSPTPKPRVSVEAGSRAGSVNKSAFNPHLNSNWADNGDEEGDGMTEKARAKLAHETQMQEEQAAKDKIRVKQQKQQAQEAKARKEKELQTRPSMESIEELEAEEQERMWSIFNQKDQLRGARSERARSERARSEAGDLLEPEDSYISHGGVSVKSRVLSGVSVRTKEKDMGPGARHGSKSGGVLTKGESHVLKVHTPL